MLSLSLPSSSLSNSYALRIKSPNSHQGRAFCRVSPHLQQFPQQQSFTGLSYNPRRASVMAKKGRRFGAVCYSSPLAPGNLQWISAISTAVLMLAKGTAIHKSFLVPLFALLAPGSIVSWMKSEYGLWTAFLALLVRLFFFIPGKGVGAAIFNIYVGDCGSLPNYEAERKPRRFYYFIGNSSLSGFPAFF
ncbi:COLD REGULATED 314 INNER MEMBRANE protein 1 [Perilla frutescens var. hirtella]|nr:COLD REGULATED 314 INNER MEMBRANE 1 [Perilla frutescens var. frutescens]KAH6793063.1 COLD REGULATED 314 INNER MEMBRANE protein 1 [Perilla frutescens var. hirtella]